MADSKTGQIGWLDITVPDADSLRDFYASVVGWEPTPLSMGEYNDYVMTAPGAAEPTTGICHARGGNASLPPVWLPYFIVTDAEKSLADALERGAQVIKPFVSYGTNSKYCVLRDPAGASFALFEAAGK